MRIFLLVLSVLIIGVAQGQQDTTIQNSEKLITIMGKVTDPDLISPFYSLMIVNKRTKVGSFGKFDGNFSVQAKQSDTILVSTRGYQVVKLCFKDSVPSDMYKVDIQLSMLKYESAIVEVKPLKTLEELKEARAKLAMEKSKTPDPKGFDAIQSPITALFNIFSKKEQSKKLLRELEYKESQKDILREMLRIYVHNDIIKLEQHEFDDFIEFLNLDENRLKYASDYELIVYIKDKFQHYLQINDYYFEK
ncbi:MAG: hypothetical protein R2799_13860 [Crocinitomicaceae bacterium]